MSQPRLQKDDLDRRVEAAFDRHRRGDLAFADRVYREVLSECPDHPRALHYLGLIAQQHKSADLALRLLSRSIEIDPSDVRAHNHLGEIYAGLNDCRAAEACFVRGLQIRPDHVGTLNNLANVIAIRDLPKAIALYKRAMTLSPDAVAVVFNLAQALERHRASDEALGLYRRTITLEPKHFHARYRLGILLEQQGKFPQALEQYLIVQRIEPGHAASLAGILASPGHSPDRAMVRRAEVMLEAPNTIDRDRIMLHHALGKHCERTGNFQVAFAHFLSAKMVYKRTRPVFDIGAVASWMRRIRAVFGREFFSTAASLTSPIAQTCQPVFIIGLPRSGTTLTEQILAGHPAVSGGGELQGIPRLIKLLGPEYPECMAAKTSNELAELTDDYLAAAGRVAGPNALRVTDKLPLNSLHLGLIAKLFPNARIVYCRRDPLDIAVSCFTELFQLEDDFTTNFEDFGHYFLEHERLMAHWQAVLPIPIHEVRYEDLVGDPGSTGRALVRHCGLEWDPGCLEFRDTDRTIQTPSRWQVRQPIYRTSVGRWKHYHSQLASLIRLLGNRGYRCSR